MSNSIDVLDGAHPSSVEVGDRMVTVKDGLTLIRGWSSRAHGAEFPSATHNIHVHFPLAKRMTRLFMGT